MEWHFNALESGRVRSAASSIFILIGIMGMGSSPRSSLASALKFQHLSIALKELIPVVLAAVTFSYQWSGKVVQFVVNNSAVVEVVKSTYSKEPHIMHLIHLLVFFAARFNLWFMASHIPGKQNILADALSINNVSLFLLQFPQTAPQGAYLSPSLVDLLTLNIPWISTNWTKQFKDSFLQD